MHSLVLYEDEGAAGFLPLTAWRTVFELRLGRNIILDRMAQQLARPVAGVWVRPLLAKVAGLRCGAPVNEPIKGPTVLANGRWFMDGTVTIPNRNVVGLIGEEVAFVVCGSEQAGRFTPEVMASAERLYEAARGWEQIVVPGRMLHYPWDMITVLPEALKSDWQPDLARLESAVDSRCYVANEDWIHVGPRTVVHPTAVLDATAGPVYLSHDVTIGAQAVIEGPIYVGTGSRVNAHAWLHGGNSFGPVCRIGGEVHGCIIHGYSNKHHHGFLGHSVVGGWVNLGAGSCNSDLKNTYGTVKVPIHGPGSPEVDSGERFFGAVIGDHAKVGINAIIPTGAVIGFAAMTATGRVLPRWVPSFGWVTDDGMKAGDVQRLLDVAAVVMGRRTVDMTNDEAALFRELGARSGVAN